MFRDPSNGLYAKGEDKYGFNIYPSGMYTTSSTSTPVGYMNSSGTFYTKAYLNYVSGSSKSSVFVATDGSVEYTESAKSVITSTGSETYGAVRCVSGDAPNPPTSNK